MIVRPWLRSISVPDIRQRGRRITEAASRPSPQARVDSLHGTPVKAARWRIGRIAKTRTGWHIHLRLDLTQGIQYLKQAEYVIVRSPGRADGAALPFRVPGGTPGE
jgi:hypothetical protein